MSSRLFCLRAATARRKGGLVRVRPHPCYRPLGGLLLAIVVTANGCATSGQNGSISKDDTSPEVEAPSKSDTPSDVASIVNVLSQQVVAWNDGDVDRFMDGYWRSDNLRFVSNGTVQYGWQKTLDNYKERYPTRASMGTLHFEDLSVRKLSEDWATVFGRYVLERTEEGGGDATGLFTLVVERQPEGWRVVQDHTSTAR